MKKRSIFVLLPLLVVTSQAISGEPLVLSPITLLKKGVLQQHDLLAGKQPVTLDAEENRKATLNELPVTDWRSLDEVELRITSKIKSASRLFICLIVPFDEQGDRHFCQEIPIDWQGEKTVKLPLRRKSRWRSWGGQADLNKITAVTFEIYGNGKTQLEISSVEVKDIADVDEAFAQKGIDVRIWDAPNGNRRQMSGAVFYLNHEKDKPCKVNMVFTPLGINGGQLRDGKPANLVLRVFSPQDRCVLAQVIGQDVRKKYVASVDLKDQPPGRYRFAVYGWHDGFAIAADPPRPIGMIGSYTLGIVDDGDYYLYCPKDVENWTLQAGSFLDNQMVTVYDGQNQEIGSTQITKGTYNLKLSSIEIKQRSTPPVFRIRKQGGGKVGLVFKGIPGILWPTPESALKAKGDCEFVGGRRISHKWQRPFAEWLNDRKKDDFTINAKMKLDITPEDLSDSLAMKLGTFCGPNHPFAVGRSLILYNQIDDPKSKKLGLFVDDKESKQLADKIELNPDAKDYDPLAKQLGYALAMCDLYAKSFGGLNPFYLKKSMRNRAWAAAFQMMLAVREQQYLTWNFVHLKIRGKMASLLLPTMPEEYAGPYRAGLIEQMGRDCYFDGYQSNQGLNVIVGLNDVATLTNDRVLKDWQERYMQAFWKDQFKDNNHGQVSAGFYQESGGLDGAYSTYSGALMMNLWHKTQDKRFAASIDKYYEILRHLAVTLPSGQLTSARQWNTRTDSNAFRWHNHRAGASLPSVATLLQHYNENHMYVKNPEWVRQRIKKYWGSNSKEELIGWWAGFGSEGFEHAGPWAKGGLLSCEEKGPWVRRFGPTYMVARKGPWQIILFGGDRWDVGDAGSSLAMLWHEVFGPLICGDTRIQRNKNNVRKIKGEWSLCFADAWDMSNGRGRTQHLFTQKSKALFDGEAEKGLLTARIIPKQSASILKRTFDLQQDAAILSASLEKGSFANHVLHLPLVSHPHLKGQALDASGSSVTFRKDETKELLGWRWTVIKRELNQGETKNDKEKAFELKHVGKTISLKFEKRYKVTFVHQEKCGPMTLNIVRVDLGSDSGQITIK